MSADRELLAAWGAGDEKAGRDLFGRYYPVVSRFFFNKVGADAPELVQQTFTRCLESHDRFEGRSTFRVFVLGIARNVFFKHLRQHYKNKRIDFAVTALSDLGPSPTSELARKEQERRLLLALRQLPIEQQVLLELYFWEGLEGGELAALYEVPEGTIRSRLARARDRLAKVFESTAATAPGSRTGPGALDQWAADVRQQLES